MLVVLSFRDCFVCLQVKRAVPRPPDIPTGDSKPMLHPATAHVQPFGRGPRIYVGGVPNCVTEEGVREHFSKWGSVSDVYFPGARGQKRLTFCFVTFDNLQSAERACDESERSLDGWVRLYHMHCALRQALSHALCIVSKL